MKFALAAAVAAVVALAGPSAGAVTKWRADNTNGHAVATFAGQRSDEVVARIYCDASAANHNGRLRLRLLQRHRGGTDVLAALVRYRTWRSSLQDQRLLVFLDGREGRLVPVLLEREDTLTKLTISDVGTMRRLIDGVATRTMALVPPGPDHLLEFPLTDLADTLAELAESHWAGSEPCHPSSASTGG